MAASSAPNVYIYPDPSLFGLNTLPPPQDCPLNRLQFPTNLSLIPAVTPAPPFAIDPVLLRLDRQATAPVAGVATNAVVPAPAPAPVPTPVPAPVPAAYPVAVPVPALVVVGLAPAQAPIPGPIPAGRLSAAGLQPFPVLVAGLQAPIELVDARDITRWNNQLEGNIPH